MDDLKAKYLGQIADARDEDALEAIRLAAVGKKGEVALKMRELGKMTPEERQTVGPALNALKVRSSVYWIASTVTSHCANLAAKAGSSIRRPPS